MIRTLLIPGLDGSPSPHWQDWWVATDPHARVVEQQSWAAPTPDAWLTEIATATLIHPGAVLVGHSLGAIAIVQLLATWPQLDIAGVMLVAPAEPSRCARIAGFGAIPERPLHVKAMVVASRNDPWMAQERARALAGSWRAGFIDKGEAGHINVASGYGPWAEGRALRERLVPEAAAATPLRPAPLPVARAGLELRP